MSRDRGLFTVTYQDTEENTGSFVEITTSQDTANLEIQYKSLMTRRGKVKTYLNYVKLDPFEGGCVFTSVNMIDLGSSLVGARVGRAKNTELAQLKQTEDLINFILSGYNF